jgi:hypothetical protein
LCFREDDTFSSTIVATRADVSVDNFGSVDSMKTMFSNSITVPAGTFREAVGEAEDSALTTTNADLPKKGLETYQNG